MGEVSGNHVSDEGLISNIFKDPLESTKRQMTQLKIEQRI